MSGERVFNFNGANVTFNDIHDNTNCTIYTAERTEKAKEATNLLPKENDYKAMVEWLKVEKEQGRDWYAMNNHNRSAMCRELSQIVGWVVDQNSLRKAQS